MRLRRSLLPFVRPLPLLVIALCASWLPSRAAHAKPRPVMRLTSSGSLAAVEPGGIATGTFALASTVRQSGEGARLRLEASDLNVTRDGDGALPELRVFLVPADPAAAKDAGPMRVDRRGRGRISVRGLKRLLPSGVSHFHQLGGNVIEVRRMSPSPATVLRATIPAFSIDGADASVSSRVVWGRFTELGPQPASSGSFELTVDDHGTGETRNRVLVVASRLFVSNYNVWLINAARSRFVDLGRLAMPRNSTSGSLSLDSRVGALPGGIASLDEFDDGTIEIRRGSQIVLRGYVVPFRSVGAAGIARRRARASGSAEQTPTAAAPRARGLVEAASHVFPQRRSESLSVRAVALDPAGSPYSVTAIHASGTRTPLGTFSTRGRTRAGALRINTTRGRRIPGGNGVVWLSRQAVEVHDAAGTLVFTGAFPSVE